MSMPTPGDPQRSNPDPTQKPPALPDEPPGTADDPGPRNVHLSDPIQVLPYLRPGELVPLRTTLGSFSPRLLGVARTLFDVEGTRLWEQLAAVDVPSIPAVEIDDAEVVEVLTDLHHASVASRPSRQYRLITALDDWVAPTSRRPESWRNLFEQLGLRTDTAMSRVTDVGSASSVLVTYLGLRFFDPPAVAVLEVLDQDQPSESPDP